MNPPVETIRLMNGLTLAQAVKASGMADTGGGAKILIREGGVLVNNVVEMRPGRKLQAGDRFHPVGGKPWLVVA
jgi:ribosome-associated protein YbcJ (S4-like RNA binding protein)